MMHLLKKELSELLNKQMLLALAGTLLLIIMLGVIMTRTVAQSFEVSGELHIVDMDNTDFSKEIISSLEQDGYTVKTCEGGESLAMLMDEMQWNEAAVITEGFTRSVLEEQKAGEIYSVSVLKSTTSLTAMVNDGASKHALTQKVQELLMHKILGDNMDFLASPVSSTSFTVANHKEAEANSTMLINSLTIFDKLMPVVLLMLIVMTSQTIITAVGAEKTDKTLETLLASPVPRTHIIGAKMLAALIVSIIYAVTYGAGFLIAMLVTVTGMDKKIDLAEALSSLAQISRAAESLDLQIPMWGWLLVILQLILTIGIALMASIILGALVQDAKGSQNAGLPILVLATLPYIMSMVSDVRLMEGAAQIVMYIIPFTHTFIATSCLRFHDMPLFWGGIAYQAVFLTATTLLALKLYRSDILFVHGGRRRKAE